MSPVSGGYCVEILRTNRPLDQKKEIYISGLVPGPWETGIQIMRVKELEAVANISRTVTYFKASFILRKTFMSASVIFKQ